MGRLGTVLDREYQPRMDTNRREEKYESTYAKPTARQAADERRFTQMKEAQIGDSREWTQRPTANGRE
jgi:hypothetical protein